ncbi:N-acetyltransferase family protein [Gracilibacillus sp. HCP3S3_G5_1]|uniref:GNAT family N-acetyltransferase n=1 Tax=unclassified Gracilibacillus TaxID=2625209 RepID=UPI003F8B5EC6
MEIRKLDVTDAENYYFLRLEALQESPQSFAASYEEEKTNTVEIYKSRLASSHKAVTLGAFIDSQLVGVVTLVKEQLVKLSHRANIVAMYVKSAFRGNAIGKKLISTLIEEARKIEGIEQLYLSVVTSNESAKRLYESVGFEVFGTGKRALKIDNTYYDEDHMILFLSRF